MNPDNFTLKVFDPKTASDAEIEAAWHFKTQMAKESSPDDPTQSLKHFKKSLENEPSFVTIYRWSLYDTSDNSETGKIVARVGGLIGHMEENQHIVQGGVQVLADYRQQGIAKYLLPKLLEVAQKHNRRLILDDTVSTIPSGEAFAKRLGAKAGLPLHQNQLELKTLNTDLMTDWSNRFKTISDDFELILWEDDIPEDEIANFCELHDVMNTAPTDDLDVEDEKLTPEQLKEYLASNKAMGIKLWLMLAKHKESNEYAGYTQLFFNPEKAHILQQGDTAVVPKYRGHSLGKILKAKNLAKAMEAVPKAELVRTTNAMSNEAMLNINTEMGFYAYKSIIVWELDVDVLETYLSN